MPEEGAGRALTEKDADEVTHGGDCKGESGREQGGSPRTKGIFEPCRLVRQVKEFPG
jgi:hypothetical protein